MGLGKQFIVYQSLAFRAVLDAYAKETVFGTDQFVGINGSTCYINILIETTKQSYLTEIRSLHLLLGSRN